MATYQTKINPDFLPTLEELAKPKFPAGYKPSAHDDLDAADAAADIADAMGVDEDYADLAIHKLTQEILRARSARKI